MIDKNILVESLNDSEKQVWFCDFQLSRRVGRCVIDLSPLNAMVKTHSPYGGDYKQLKISNIISGKRNWRPCLVSYPMFETEKEALDYYNQKVKNEILRIEQNKEKKIKQFDSYIERAKTFLKE